MHFISGVKNSFSGFSASRSFLKEEDPKSRVKHCFQRRTTEEFMYKEVQEIMRVLRLILFQFVQFQFRVFLIKKKKTCLFLCLVVYLYKVSLNPNTIHHYLLLNHIHISIP